MIHVFVEYGNTRIDGKDVREVNKVRLELDDELRPLVIKLLERLIDNKKPEHGIDIKGFDKIEWNLDKPSP